MVDRLSNQESKYSWKIMEWFPDLSREALDKLSVMHRELVRLNESLDLVSHRTLQFSDVIHFSDSIRGSKLIFDDSNPDRILDIGSGGGFPGLVFAARYPQVKVYLNEIDPKRAEFLKQTANKAGISNVEVVGSTLDKLQNSSFRVVMSRGVAPIATMAIATRRIVKKSGGLYLFKSEEWGREIAELPIQACSHWSPSLVGDYGLPAGGIKLSIVRLSKLSD